MTIFHGLSAFPITPIDTDGHVDPGALGGLLERLVAAGVDSVGLLGSTGGYAYLTRRERQRTVATAVAYIEGRTPLIVGVGALRTDEAQALAEDAAAAGADALLLAPMSYTPLTQEEVYRHCVAVAGVTNLPLCLYNNPGTTHFSFEPRLIARLAAVPNIVAVKMPLPPDGDIAAELAGLRSQVPAGFAIGYSGDWGAAGALLAGADAWYSVVGGTLPSAAIRLTRAAAKGDAVEAGRIDAGFEPLWRLFKEFGSFRVVHAMANRLGLSAGQPPRPVLPLGDADCLRLAAVLDELRSAGLAD